MLVTVRYAAQKKVPKKAYKNLRHRLRGGSGDHGLAEPAGA